jgi:hypothetical protein
MKTSFTNIDNKKKFSMYTKPQSGLPRAISATLKKNPLDSPSLPFFKPGTQISFTKTSPNSNMSRMKAMTSSNLEKERLYEECMKLKGTINNLQRELYFYKSEVNKKDLELRKQNKVVEEMLVESQGIQMGIGAADLQAKIMNKFKENSLISNLKNTYKEAKRDLKEKTHQLEELKKTVKATKINEIILENQTLIEELNRMRTNNEILFRQNMQFEKLQKEYFVLQDSFNRQEMLILQLQEVNNSLQNGATAEFTSTANINSKNIKDYNKGNLSSNSEFQILGKELE